MWRDTVNSALGRLGYRIQRVDSRGGDAASAVGAQAAPTGPSSKPGQSGKPGKPGKSTGGGKRAVKGTGEAPLPRGIDDRDGVILRRVRPRTMTSWVKLHALVLAARHISEHRIPGDIVECGVWRGGSMQAIALVLAELGDERHLHLFDTFEGMPPPGEHDVRHDGAPAEDLLEQADRDAPVWAVAGLDDVRQAMTEIDWPADLASFHVGMVEDTVPAAAPDQIALLRLDTDWYASTKHELEHLYHRLSPGGILIIDDYGHWEGSRRATEEFLADTGAELLLVPISTGRIAVKPYLSDRLTGAGGSGVAHQV